MMLKRSEWHNIISPNTWHWFQAGSKGLLFGLTKLAEIRK